MSRRVVVSGGGTGIGRAIAHRFAAVGDTVLAMSRAYGFTALWNHLGHPAASVPACQSRSSMPLSVQVVGRRGADADVVATSGSADLFSCFCNPSWGRRRTSTTEAWTFGQSQHVLILEDHMNKQSKIYTGLGSMVLVSTMAVAGMAGSGAASAATGGLSTLTFNGVHLHAHLNPLNNSGGHGNSDVRFDGTRAHVDIDAYNLLKGMPHAQHIHFGRDARHECPTAFDDKNGDHRLTTTDGAPAYGPIRKSLTTRGDYSPASALAVNRFPTTPKGEEHYDRNINFSGDALRRAVKNGKGVLVIHGLDYNGNGKYDFGGAGRSELDPSLPAEATDPAVCGVLRVR